MQGAIVQGLTDDWRVRLAFPIFQLIDFLLSRQRVARFLFNNFRTKDNLKKVLQVITFAKPLQPQRAAGGGCCGQDLYDLCR